jgi:hypothetical protein
MVDGLVVPSTPSRGPWTTELSTSPRYTRNAQTDKTITEEQWITVSKVSKARATFEGPIHLLPGNMNICGVGIDG